jgi:hypothetical protein
VIGLEGAIELKRWDLVWLYLAIGVAEMASRLPPESLDELIGLLAWDEESGEGGGSRADQGGA